MSLVEGSYDTATGKFSVTVDGKKVPNVYSFSICAPIGYDNDEDDSVYGKVYCSVSSSEKVGDLRRQICYTNASSDKAKDLLKEGKAKASKALRDFVVETNNPLRYQEMLLNELTQK